MPAARYVIRFGGSKNEADLGGVFLQSGGTLGGAAARDDTDFGLTHAERATKTLLTEKHVALEIPLSDKLVASSAALFKEETGADGVEGAPGVGEILLLSDRTQLFGTSSRMGASINGTWAHTAAGYTTAPLSSLFTTADTSSLTADADKENATIGAIAARVAAPFSMLSMKYPNWEAVQAVVGTNQPVVVRVDEDGTETPVSVAFFTPNKQAARLAQVEPLIKAIYDKAWALTESVPYAASPTLTKSVMRKPYGLNGSPYALAAEANDTPNAMTDETLESVLSRAIEVEVQGAHRHVQLLDDLRTPSFQSTLLHGKSVATAVSAMCAFLVPYRVDGTPVVAPTGLLMRETESWPVEPLRKIGVSAEDCDGSAGVASAAVKRAVQLNDDPSVDMNRFPNLRAVANSIGAHYVYGIAVLGANAGHAAAANEAATAVAGHAIMLAVPKLSIAQALERGGLSTITGAPVVDPTMRQAVTNARYDALYPPELVARMPEGERPHFESHAASKASLVSNPVTGLQPLAFEGTTYASSVLYTHDAVERANLQEFYLRDKVVSESMSPNVSRTFKALSVGAEGDHAFYKGFVEMGMSLDSPLFTDPVLRKLGYATPHLRFTQVALGGPLVAAGASPKELATHEFAAIPLWTANAEQGALLDEAHAESIANTMPARKVPLELAADTVADLRASLDSLRGLDAFLHAEGKTETRYHETSHVMSFAALVHNPKAVQAFVDLVKGNPDTLGEVYGLDEPVTGLAADASGEQLGRFVAVELMVPVE